MLSVSGLRVCLTVALLLDHSFYSLCDGVIYRFVTRKAIHDLWGCVRGFQGYSGPSKVRPHSFSSFLKTNIEAASQNTAPDPSSMIPRTQSFLPSRLVTTLRHSTTLGNGNLFL